ncbi:MAG: immunity 8 family protein [Candidatus Sedimenticola sp. (ex Thyasira tokunagai)]
MDAELKRVHSPDIDSLSSYQPEEPECFAFLLQAMIGPKGEDWEESFDIEVCTPKWIEKTYGLDEIVIGRHYFIVREYNYENIIRTIDKYLMHCSGDDWKEVAARVSRLGRWEFEDYVE